MAQHEEEKRQLIEAKKLVNKGFSLVTGEHFNEAIICCDEVVTKFGENKQPEFLEVVARALVVKGFSLYRSNQEKDAIDLYDKFLDKFGEYKQPELLIPLSWVLTYKGVCFAKLSRFEEAISIFDEVVKKFDMTNQPDEILGNVILSYSGKGSILFDRHNYKEALKEYDSVLKIKPGEFRAFANRMKILFLLGRTEEAFTTLEEAFELFKDSPFSLAFIFFSLIAPLWQRESDLQKGVGMYVQKGGKAYLVEGLTIWLKSLLPITEDKAKGLEGMENMLSKVLAAVEETKSILQVLRALRRYALGDPIAFMEIPLEFRRLISNAA